MSLDAIEEITFPTPGGHEATFLYRPDTTDWNTVASCCKEDEYGLPSGLSGWAADIGAHIGGATVALALDNPDLCIIALEPLPENLDMLRANVARNGIGDRVAIVEGAVGVDVIFYGWSATPSMVAHRYIGNMVGESLAPQSEVHPTVYTLSGLLDLAGNPLVFLKTDCEGGEWSMLDDPRIGEVATISGEWHAVEGRVGADMVVLLAATHAVTFGTGIGGGGFRAVRHV